MLADLIKIKSVNDHELEVAEYLKDLFQKNDIHSEILPIKGQRANLVAEIGSGAPVLAVSGHMDVVDPGNLAAWDSDPFTMTEKDGKLFGRGITDMKAGLGVFVMGRFVLITVGLA
ncbi:M20/M25/M40 family metallo-hydrolase, partial [Pediococcus acidilactici]|nr:M20/M25/M40 family metallo-hydrolase [Pediococcus acidilactici]